MKTVFQNLSRESSSNPSLIFIVLALWCIPLSYGCNSVSLALLMGYSLFTLKKSNFHLDAALMLPVALFALMALSLCWTHDLAASLRALAKGLPFLLIPISLSLLAPITRPQRQLIFKYYSYGIVLFTFFCLCKAIIRFLLMRNTGVFFYHELVSEDVNAVHVSVYVAMALFYFLTNSARSRSGKIAIALLFVFLVLLSSKNVMVIFFVLLCIYALWHFKSVQKRKYIGIGIGVTVILLLVFSAKIRERFRIEYDSNTSETSLNYDIGTPSEKVYNVSVKKAWTAPKFNANDFFPGTAFRVYQFRIFCEMLHEDPIFFTGYGLNATDFRIAQKRVEHGLYEGYEKNNFHNEYVQLFAELGFFGFLILLAMVLVNLRSALNSKDFMHISFAVLMISLFLTESFLSRQRGIVFFTMMYCLYNSGSPKFRPKTK